MSLTSSLLIGQTALTASQVALQVTGNNLANAATPGYHRQRVDLTTIAGQRQGNVFTGRGVQISDIRRVVDPALQARLRGAIAQEQAADVEHRLLSTIESLTSELTGTDLSSQLSKFFNAFSEIANNPASAVMRSNVIEEGAALASYIRGLRTDLLQTRSQVDAELAANVKQADGLVRQIANLNGAISISEVGNGQNAGLRDQRDELVRQLSELFEVTIVEQPGGAVDVLIDSQPVVLGSESRGLELRTREVGGEPQVDVLISTTGTSLKVKGGRIGALLEGRVGNVQQAIDSLDSLASALIFEVNKLHSVGRPSGRITDQTGWFVVPPADQSRALNDPANTALSSLPFGPVNGSFTVTMHDASGNKSTTTILVDLDGLDSGGNPGFGDDTSLEDLRAALNAIPNLNAEITPDGRLRLYTDQGSDVSFSDDTSGVLAVLGINTYFQGSTAQDIAVRSDLRNDPGKLTIGMLDGTNETALAIAQLRDEKITSLSGLSLHDSWQQFSDRSAVRTAGAAVRVGALSSVRASLEAQESALGGVSVDEESINLLKYQQQYQGAARFISVIDEMTQILLNLV